MQPTTAQPFLAAMWALLIAANAFARDGSQWDGQDSRIKEWFEHLKQPDHPRLSCCGEAEAYEADSYQVEGITTSQSSPDIAPPRTSPGSHIPAARPLQVAPDLSGGLIFPLNRTSAAARRDGRQWVPTAASGDCGHPPGGDTACDG